MSAPTLPQLHCPYDWCESQDREPHASHTTGHGSLAFVRDPSAYDSDQEPQDMALLWIDREDDRTLMTMSLGPGDGHRFPTLRFTVDHVERLAEQVLYWLALMRGVSIHTADGVAQAAVAALHLDREAVTQ
jgi:hypothetical protein